ncbi:hypothetical protein [Bradyrhizobium sp. Cp5.3]|uniref:hypothetical protein n=1 Tax=Bradyrhizobium sp. Cp5.3 TaxID=443598 RepID=UPI0012EC143A|nr:hypothetical protein [Bradyrhizobium sp. Cp5.3]
MDAGGESAITLDAVGTINSSNQYVHGDSYSQSSSAGRDVLIIQGNVIFGPPRDNLIRAAEDQQIAPSASSEMAFAGELQPWWESGKPTMDDLCYVVALAFLEGSDFRSIARYGAELRKQVEYSSTAAAPSSISPARQATASRIIARMGAYRAQQSEVRDRELIFFRESVWRSQCLVAIWRDFSGSILPVSDWLLATAREIGGPARTSLQQAVAILFAKFPDDVYQTLILPLADAGIPQRWLAANSLGAALRVDAAEKVRAKLKAASHLSHGRAAASVAALCVGTAFARQVPAAAAEFLIALLEHHHEVDDALGIAIEGLIREARSSATSAEAVLTCLANWPRWEQLGPDVVGDLVATYLRETIEGVPAFANAADAVRHFKREAERDANAKKGSFKFAEIAEILGVISAAILNPHAGREKKGLNSNDASDEKRKSVAVFAARDPKVSDVAGALVIRLLRFGPTYVAAWSLLRDLLRWSDVEQALGAVAIVKRVFSLAADPERERFLEHLKRWSREPAVRKTIEGYLQSMTLPPAHS